MAVNHNHELETQSVTRDTRTTERRLLDWLFRPTNFRRVLVVLLIGQVLMPALWALYLVVIWGMTMSFNSKAFRLPLRIPKDIGGLDRSDYVDERIEGRIWSLARKVRIVRKYLPAAGILFFGFLRSLERDWAGKEYEQGKELWATNSDCRTHMFAAGTTGSGKTEALIGLAYNAMCWGSGVCYGDGKADSNLPFCLWSLSRRRGIEDNFLLLNFLSGGQDPFKAMVEAEKQNQAGRASSQIQSNSLNAFSDGAPDFLTQLMGSLQTKATGEGGQWQMKAMNFMDAELRTLCYLRARGEGDTSLASIRHYMALQNLVQLYIRGKRGEIPETAFLPLKSYFETGLPGFNPALAEDPAKWDPEVFNQHGYLTGQFARTLSMLMDTYGAIFSERYAEVNMRDVMINNRVLVVLIPSLEKSPAEAAAVGKLYTASQRLTMAEDLGYRVEGTREQALDSKETNSPFPKIIINDEQAYWFSEGLAVMFAQARGLGYMMVASVQDVQGLKRGEAKEEHGSLIANTKIKYSLALEDPDDTFDLIRKAGGQAYYSVLSGHKERNGSLALSSTEAERSSSVQLRDRIELQDLKDLSAGEGIVIFKGSVVPFSAFYIPDDLKKTRVLSARLNRFLQIERPTLERLPKSAQKKPGRDASASKLIAAQLRRSERPFYPKLDDPILQAVIESARHMDSSDRLDPPAADRGVVLFEAARRALRSAREQGLTPNYHHARQDEAEFDAAGEGDVLAEYAYIED